MTDFVLTFRASAVKRNMLIEKRLYIQVSIYKTTGCRYELSLCFVLCLSFMFAFIFVNKFHISGTCFQVLSSSPTQGGAGDGSGVCLLAGGPLDCSQSSIFL